MPKRNENIGVIYPRNSSSPVKITDAKLAFDINNPEGLGTSDKEANDKIIKWNPKYVYGAEDPLLPPTDEVFTTYKMRNFRGGVSEFKIYKHDIDGVEVLEYYIDPFTGPGIPTYLTKEECPKLQKLQTEWDNKYGKGKMFSYFSNIRGQLTDAPTGVKKAFNEVIKYFDNSEESVYVNNSSDTSTNEMVGTRFESENEDLLSRIKEYLKDKGYTITERYNKILTAPNKKLSIKDLEQVARYLNIVLIGKYPDMDGYEIK